MKKKKQPNKNNLSSTYYCACHTGSGLETTSLPTSLPLPPFGDHCVINLCHFSTWSGKLPYTPLNTANSNKLVSYRGLISYGFGNILKKAATFFTSPFLYKQTKPLEMDLLLLPQCHISCNSRQSKGTSNSYMESRLQNMWRISPSI